MSAPAFFRRLSGAALTFLLFAGGAAGLACSASLLRAHAVSIRVMRQEALPAAAEAAALEERLAVLRRQVEASKLASALHVGSQEERLHAYVFPAAMDRTVSFLNGTLEWLRGSGDLRDASAITLGDLQPVTGSGANGLRRRSVAFSVVVREAGMRSLLRAVDLTGLLNLQDALTGDQLQHLFTLTERENPTGIVALGQFLSADLFTYLREPKGFDERFLASFSSDAFAAAVRDIGGSPLLREGSQMARGPWGDFLKRERLWPLPYLAVRDAAAEPAQDGWIRLTLTLEATMRKPVL